MTPEQRKGSKSGTAALAVLAVQLLEQADYVNPRFRYVGLATVQHHQNFGMQGGKGGEFSVVFPKITTRTLNGEKLLNLYKKI